MNDLQQDIRRKTNYEQWSKEESDTLLEIMVDAVNYGWRDNNGCFSKQTVEERILPALNTKLGCQKTYSNYQSRLKWFKNRWNSFSTLMRFNSGFGYETTTKTFTATDEVWDEYFKAHPKDAVLRNGIHGDYELLGIAVGNNVAVGKKSIGLGSVTDARTLGVEKTSNARITDLSYDIDSNTFVRPTNGDLPSDPLSPIQSPEYVEVPTHKTNQKKRNRSRFERSSPENDLIEKFDKISTSFEGIFNLLEKREYGIEKREKEREKEKEYTLWDAIKEIPDLNEDTRFKALMLLDTKGRKDVFFKMTLEERANWISHMMQNIP